jgi:hypothetical protein
MAVYEVEIYGKTFDVEASSQDQIPSIVDRIVKMYNLKPTDTQPVEGPPAPPEATAAPTEALLPSAASEEAMIGKPETTAGGVAGAALRGLSPAAVGAVGGAIMGGAPTGGIGAVPGALIGAAGMTLADPVVAGINSLFGTHYTKPSDALNHYLTQLGVPNPDTQAERLAGAAGRGVGEGLGQLGLGKALMASARPAMQAAGRFFAEKPAEQIASSVGSEVGMQSAKEAGYGPTGQLLAGLGGGMGAGIGAGARPTVSAAAALPEGAVQAEKRGIQTITSQEFKPETPLGNALAKSREITPFGTGSLLRKQEKQRSQAIQDFVSEYAGVGSPTLTEELANQAISQREKIVKKLSGNKQEVLGRLSTTGQLVDMSATAKKAEDLALELENISPTANKQAIDQLINFATEITGKTPEEVEQRRKVLFKSLSDPTIGTPKDMASKAYNEVYGALNQDLGNHIKQFGKPTDFTKWSVSNRALSDLADDLKASSFNSLLKKGELTPEIVNNVLFTDKKSSIERLYKNLSTEGREVGRAAIITRALENATDPSGVIVPNRFATQLGKLENQVNVFFTGSDLDAVQGLQKALNYTRRAGEFAANPPTGAQAVPFVAFSGLQSQLGLVGAGLAAALNTGLVRLYESKAGRNLLTQLGRVKSNSSSERTVLTSIANYLGSNKDLLEPQQQPTQE